MNFLFEVAFKLLFQIVAEIVLSFAAKIALSSMFLFFRRTGDFLIELVTPDYFRDHSNVPVDRKALHPVPDWAAALLGFCFWCEFAAAVYVSLPWFESL